MHPSTTWAGISFGKLLELLAGAIAALNPALIFWSIVLVAVITAAIILTMKAFVKQTPKARQDIIKLVEALRRRTPKP
jgi:hypothetical protein